MHPVQRHPILYNARPRANIQISQEETCPVKVARQILLETAAQLEDYHEHLNSWIGFFHICILWLRDSRTAQKRRTSRALISWARKSSSNDDSVECILSRFDLSRNELSLLLSDNVWKEASDILNQKGRILKNKEHAGGNSQEPPIPKSKERLYLNTGLLLSASNLSHALAEWMKLVHKYIRPYPRSPFIFPYIHTREEKCMRQYGKELSEFSNGLVKSAKRIKFMLGEMTSQSVELDFRSLDTLPSTCSDQEYQRA